MIKYKIFKLIHDYPIEIYLMWIILIFTILSLAMRIYCNATNVKKYMMINNL